MNKRLLHLFNEAGFHQPEMERLGIEDKFGKFAELIVMECADVAFLEANSRKTQRAVLQHFGVEE